ncbi:M67 family metallopeptidase [Nitrososphaera sp.]|uniref:M67 family metallopeptidase n=1 Tax=Nitrososphaera sp. TaxID=1971748 RepID=UPI00307DB385
MTARTISISAEQLAELEELAERSLPAESCAFLLGAGADEATAAIAVREVLPVENIDRSRVSFTMAPDDVLRAYQAAEERGLGVVGIFHSHPSVPSPSGTDARFMEVNPVVWVIYSTTENRFSAWVFDDDGAIKKVEIVTGSP